MKTFITAHSGADGRPDNSMEYVQYAIASSADALEVDVRRAADGCLRLAHDEAALDAPALADVLARVAKHPSIKINCDLKTAGLEEAVCQLAAEAGLAGRVILTGTVDAEKAPGLRDTAEIYLNMEEYVQDLYLGFREFPDFDLRAAEAIAGTCLKNGIKTVNVYQGIVTRRMIETLAAQGIGLSVWTVDVPQEAQWFLSRGVTNITTRTLQTALDLRAALTVEREF
jgi:glycerophosphoryl diester phosphodiesterase